MEKPKILVVDDEKEICELTKNFLTRRNYLCFGAYTDKEALELVEREHPQLVLLDLRIGDVSGLEVLTKIKAYDSAIKVIMVTGLTDDESIQQAKALGADDYISKPFTSNFLYELLSRKLPVSP